MEQYAKYVTRAKELGVTDAKIIPTETVQTAEWVRIKCHFGCSGYGRRPTCPPNSPTPEQTKRMLAEYTYGLLVHTDTGIDLDIIIFELEKEIFFDGYYKAFGMSAGPCRLCDRCAKRCRRPFEARPSMEACGIDVYATVRAHGFPLEVVRTRKDKTNYYGLVLIE